VKPHDMSARPAISTAGPLRLLRQLRQLNGDSSVTRGQMIRGGPARAPTALTVVWATAVVPQGVQPPACPDWGQGDILVISAKSRVV
jgi:hypothetical protein